MEVKTYIYIRFSNWFGNLIWYLVIKVKSSHDRQWWSSVNDHFRDNECRTAISVLGIFARVRHPPVWCTRAVTLNCDSKFEISLAIFLICFKFFQRMLWLFDNWQRDLQSAWTSSDLEHPAMDHDNSAQTKNFEGSGDAGLKMASANILLSTFYKNWIFWVIKCYIMTTKGVIKYNSL